MHAPSKTPRSAILPSGQLPPTTSTKSAVERPSDCEGLKTLALLLLVLAFSVLCVGCSTPVVPEKVSSTEISFDGNDQTSGIVRSTPNGFIVTLNFRARYNALIALYGSDFIPRLKIDQDLAPIADDLWLISKQGMIHFLEMNAWRKAALKPVNL